MATNTRDVDLVVIGAGPGGEALAGRAAAAGLGVVAIDRHLVGGECPYYGCIPSKIMLRAADTIAEAHRASRLAGETTVDPSWNIVAARISGQATTGWDDTVATERLRKFGAEVIHGSARLDGPSQVKVTFPDDSPPLTFRARRGVVLNPGTRLVEPKIAGLSATPYWTNRDAVQATTLPTTMIILGGGPVGCELAQVFARFGVDVTMVDPSPRLLPGGEPEASATVQQVFEEDRIRVLTGRRPLRVQHQNTTTSELFEVDLDTGQRLSGQRLLVATGRTPNLDDIGMDTIGLPAGRLSVDKYLRVQGSEENTWLWAIGDVTGHGAFTHVSMYQAGLVIRDILHQDPRPAEYHAVPSVTFTDPEVASVGLTATQAAEAGLDIRTGYADLTKSSRGFTHDLQHGFVKLVEHDGRLVGATVVGPAAGEVCSMLTLAVHARIPVETLRTMIYAYPTFHRAIETALASIPQH